MHGDRARLARDELVVIEIAFIVAHGASIYAPIHLDYLVIQLLRFLIVAILEPLSFIEIAPSKKRPMGIFAGSTMRKDDFHFLVCPMPACFSNSVGDMNLASPAQSEHWQST